MVPMIVVLGNYSLAFAADSGMGTQHLNLSEVEKEITGYVINPRYEDDPYILVTVMEAFAGARGFNGGVGACLVQEATGEIVERGHNRQYEPYFRSDLHAEMDLLTRYEDKIRLTRSRESQDPELRDPRSSMKGLILYTSVEPCPMCLTRIINSGIKKVYYAAPDNNGGMVQRFDNLPPFWRNMAQGMVFAPARCSPDLKLLAQKLFRPKHRLGIQNGGAS